MLEFIKDYPGISTLVVATFFTCLGFIGKTIIGFYSENRRRKEHLQEFFLKEKVEAAKKASQFYYENLSLLKLYSQKLENYSNEKEMSDVVDESLEKSIQNIAKHINNPENYEHHHIRMFYDIDESEVDMLTIQFLRVAQDLNEIESKYSNLSEVPDEVAMKAMELVCQFKSKLELLKEFYERQLLIIRKDLQTYLK